MSGHHEGSFGVCPTCGKQCFRTKADAKAASRRKGHRKGRLSAYRCGDYWHYGHLHPAVVAGRVRRDQIKNRRRTA